MNTSVETRTLLNVPGANGALLADSGYEMPTSFAQQRLWFIEQLAPGARAYYIPIAIRINGLLERSQRWLVRLLRLCAGMRCCARSSLAEMVSRSR